HSTRFAYRSAYDPQTRCTHDPYSLNHHFTARRRRRRGRGLPMAAPPLLHRRDQRRVELPVRGRPARGARGRDDLVHVVPQRPAAPVAVAPAQRREPVEDVAHVTEHGPLRTRTRAATSGAPSSPACTSHTTAGHPATSTSPPRSRGRTRTGRRTPV